MEDAKDKKHKSGGEKRWSEKGRGGQTRENKIAFTGQHLVTQPEGRSLSQHSRSEFLTFPSDADHIK